MGTNITGIGNANAIGFKSRVTGGIYFPPELKDALVGVWSAYGKSNDSTDRNIIKNKIKDRGGDFVISNAAFKLNSGFGKYEVDFTTWSKVAGTSIITDSKYVLTDEKAITNGGYFLWNRLAKDSFKVKISNIPNGGWMSYRYRITEEDTQISSLFIREDGIYTLPATVAGSDVDFFISTASAPAKDWVGLTITQIPSFEGAFVTDGIDDLITSTKTVQEMLGGSNEITVVSMIHQIGLGCRTNFICDKGSYWRCNEVANTGEGKTGIYGYSSTNISVNTPNIINNVLGDKVDYSVTGDRNDLTPSQFSVVGYISSSGKISYTSSVAWYWTIIANKVLTTDEINQVIAYFNLDRTLNPDILCNIIKQGITNENHEEFGDKLIDFSGNGRDIQLNNIAWKGDSGIGKYNFSNINIIANRFEGTVTTNKCHFTKKLINTTSNFCDLIVISPNEPIKFKVSGLSDGRKLFVANKSGSGSNYNFDNGEHEVSLSFSEGVGQNNPFGVTGDIGDIDVTVEFIPSHAGSLCLDGVNNFGKVTGMPVYKDYTVVTDREIFAYIGAISSKNNPGAFIETAGSSVYSFGQGTFSLNFISTRSISYLSKYSYCGQSITAGAAEDGTDMWLGTIRDNDSRFLNGAIYSLMSFPYSMSEFLIERQLKKHKLGTLYPDMVEFRPVIKSNASYDNIVFYYKNEKVENGTYLTVGSSIGMHIRLSSSPVNEIKSITVNGIPATFKYHDANNNIYQYNFNLTSKSPQKINITIDEYIRYEDIVQPYPILLRFKDENGNEVS